MAQFASDTFSGTIGGSQTLQAYNPAWSKQTGWTRDAHIGVLDQYAMNLSNFEGAVYQHSGAPLGPNYTVSAYISRPTSSGATPQMGVCARMQSGVQTMYAVLYTGSANNIRMFKYVGGSQAQLGSTYLYTLTSTPAKLTIRVENDQISAYLDDSLIIGPVTDTSITTSGKSGIYLFSMREPGVADTGTLDTFSGDDILASDITAPILSSASGTGGTLTSSGSVNTDEANGTLYSVLSTLSTTPSKAQVKSGQDSSGSAGVRSVSQSVTSTGVQSVVPATTAAGTYYWHFMHEDSSGNQSNVLSSISFTVSSAAPSNNIVAASNYYRLFWSL